MLTLRTVTPLLCNLSTKITTAIRYKKYCSHKYFLVPTLLYSCYLTKSSSRVTHIQKVRGYLTLSRTAVVYLRISVKIGYVNRPRPLSILSVILFGVHNLTVRSGISHFVHEVRAKTPPSWEINIWNCDSNFVILDFYFNCDSRYKVKV